MTRTLHSSTLMGLLVLMVACPSRRSPRSSDTPGPPPPEKDSSTPPADDLEAYAPLGSEGDLRARGAFRAERSKAAASGLADRWLTLTFQTQGADGAWWTLSPGGELRSGEVVVTEIELRQPAHVYIINVSASGEAVLLYPNAEYRDQDVLLGAGTHRLPPARSQYPYIKMDDEVGMEHFFVVATSDAIAGVDRELAELIAKIQRGESLPLLVGGRRASGSGRTKRRKAAEPSRTQAEMNAELFRSNVGVTPKLMSRGTYGSRAEGSAIDAKAGVDGVVVIPFHFHHI